MTMRATTIVFLAGCCGASPPTPVQPRMVDGPAQQASVVFVQSNDGEAQYRGVPGEAALAYVQLINNGPGPIDVDVLCVVKDQRDGVEVDRTLARWTTRVIGLPPGERRLAYLTAPAAGTRALPAAVGLPTSCGTRLAGSDGPYVHTRTDWPYYAPYVAPDLRWRHDGPALDAYDCTTGAAPVAGRDICVEAFVGASAGMNSAEAQAQRFAVACRLGGRLQRLVTALADRRGPVRLRFAAPPAGRHPLRCTIDDLGHVTESDERNNLATTPVAVLADVRDWRYAVAIRRVAPAATWLRGGDDSPREPAYDLAVVVANTGVHGLRDLAIECTGPGVRFTGGGVASLPEHLLGPGEVTLHLQSDAPRPPPGRVTLTCTLRLTRPALAPPATFTATVHLPP